MATVYDTLGGVVSQLDTLGDGTTYAYDGFHNLASETDGDGNTTIFVQDALGNLLSETDADDNTTNVQLRHARPPDRTMRVGRPERTATKLESDTLRRPRMFITPIATSS